MPDDIEKVVQETVDDKTFKLMLEYIKTDYGKILTELSLLRDQYVELNKIVAILQAYIVQEEKNKEQQHKENTIAVTKTAAVWCFIGSICSGMVTTVILMIFKH